MLVGSFVRSHFFPGRPQPHLVNLYAWECGYDEDGCWDDARAARALRMSREERENAKKAEAARKRAAVNARREAGQRQHDASTRPATRPLKNKLIFEALSGRTTYIHTYIHTYLTQSDRPPALALAP